VVGNLIVRAWLAVLIYCNAIIIMIMTRTLYDLCREFVLVLLLRWNYFAGETNWICGGSFVLIQGSQPALPVVRMQALVIDGMMRAIVCTTLCNA